MDDRKICKRREEGFLALWALSLGASRRAEPVTPREAPTRRPKAGPARARRAAAERKPGG